MSLLLQKLAPHKLLSNLANCIANCECNILKNYIIKDFIKKYNIDLSEAIREKPEEYKSFNDFFTRLLKPSAREIDMAKNAIVSPADGILSEYGCIKENTLIQAKGMEYSLESLLANKNAGQNFYNGSFMTIYLAPSNYHRVHMPFTGVLENMTYIPGRLFSVNTETANSLPGLFTKNERVVSTFNTDLGKVAVILVGAMIVGSIETTWHGTVSPPHHKEIKTWEYNPTPTNRIKINKGEEMGLFKLGSTVIVLFENKVGWQALEKGKEITLGNKIADI